MTVSRTLQNTLQLMGIVVLKCGIKAEAVIDTAMTASVMEWKLGMKVGLVKRRQPVQVIQADGMALVRGSLIVNSSFRFLDQEPTFNISLIRPTMSLTPSSFLTDWFLDTEVLYISWRDMILSLS